MKKIIPLPKKDIGPFIDITADAYPGLKIVTPEDKKRVRDRLTRKAKDKRVSYWGAYENNEMQGVIILYDYTMNFFGHKVLAGGGGSLAVSLMHKKEHVARDIMKFFLKHYRQRKAPFAVLWPFRPDFYRQMGCGYGSKGHVYKVRPSDLPFDKSKKYVRFLGLQDMKAVNDCYNRHVDRTHGMIEEALVNLKFRFEAVKTTKWIGFEKNGRMEGYLIFRFERGLETNFVDNHIRVTELVYETPEALTGLMSFLHTQFDQINRIIIHTSDDDFHHLLKDPRNDSGNLLEPVYHESHVSGVGIMFRVLNTRDLFRILQDHNFGGQTCRLKLVVRDTFLKENDTTLVIYFEDGKSVVKSGRAASDVTLKLDISDFSSLILGAVSLKSLHRYGRVELSSADYLDQLNRLFATEQKPICTTSF